MKYLVVFSLFLVILFSIILLPILVSNFFLLFFKIHGKFHRIFGLAYLIWFVYGLVLSVTESGFDPQISDDFLSFHLFYDLILGTFGTLLTLSAAFEFKHKGIKNVASGTLDEHATVTFSEMIEHGFYQALNLSQIIFLYSFYYLDLSSIPSKVISVFLVTSPWLFRSKFPINKFSDNYNKPNNRSTWFIKLLYRIKKYQYVFYKHFVLHGLNISVALKGHILPTQPSFRLFWLVLNLSYVMEFFLQSLVRRRLLTQSSMLALQQILMTAASLSALSVLMHVDPLISLLSLALNFLNRGQDLQNTLLILTSTLLYRQTR